MSLSTLLSEFSQFDPHSEENVTADDLVEERIAQEAEDEEADAVNDHIEKAVEEQGRGNLELPTDLLSRFEVLQDLAVDAWASSTVRVYRGQIELFMKFIRENAPELLDQIENPGPYTPKMICLWISSMCEKPDPASESQFIRERRNGTWSHAEKMRAAASFLYSHQLRRGREQYREDDMGRWRGNPVLSTEVSQYMKSLRRRKAKEGQKPESVRAITQENLRELYLFNSNFPPLSHPQRLPRTASGKQPWAGYRKRVMMSLLYAIAFVCFLRIDEALRLEFRHFRLVDKIKGRLEITLDFRKTAQDGGIRPFVVYYDPGTPWLDIPALFIEWLSISQIRSGFLFRPFNALDQPMLDRNVAVRQGVFLADFRTNLAEIGLDAASFGGHSFRRGGVQYFANEKRWSLTKLCFWGGWSLDFDNPTILRYLIGNNDEPIYTMDECQDPDAKVAIKCTACGRDCNCAGKLL